MWFVRRNPGSFRAGVEVPKRGQNGSQETPNSLLVSTHLPKRRQTQQRAMLKPKLKAGNHPETWKGCNKITFSACRFQEAPGTLLDLFWTRFEAPSSAPKSAQDASQEGSRSSLNLKQIQRHLGVTFRPPNRTRETLHDKVSNDYAL